MSADFTSGLFLGLRHPSAQLGWWRELTSGKPAGLAEATGSRAVAAQLALRQGAEAGVLARSSLHALVDVLIALTSKGGAVVLDEHAYPISRWAAAIAGSYGARVGTYRHHDPDDAAHCVRRSRSGGRSVVLADGWCTGCLRPSPVARLAGTAQETNSVLVLDDSLAAGVLGVRGRGQPMLGVGGTGTARWLGLQHRNLVWVASAAKGWGAPVAAITGPSHYVDEIREAGPTRIHASQPARTDVAALRNAIGDPSLLYRRQRLADHIRLVRTALVDDGFSPVGCAFPLIALDQTRDDALALHEGLRGRGIRTLLVERRCAQRVSVSLCLRADHGQREIDQLLVAVRAVRQRRPA